MPLYRLVYILDPNKETRKAIETNLIEGGDIAYSYFESLRDVQADQYIEGVLLSEITEKRNGHKLKGYAIQKGARGSTKENFKISSPSLHGLFATATMRKELGVPQKNHLMEIVLIGRVIKVL